MPQSKGKTNVLTNVRRTEEDVTKDSYRTLNYFDASIPKLENQKHDSLLREAVENIHWKEKKTVSEFKTEKKTMKKAVDGYKMQKEAAKKATADVVIASRARPDTRGSMYIDPYRQSRLEIGAKLLSTSSFKTSISSDSSDDDDFRLGWFSRHEALPKRRYKPRTRKKAFMYRTSDLSRRPKSTSDVYKDLPTPDELKAMVRAKTSGANNMRRDPWNSFRDDSDSSDSESLSREIVTHKSMYLKGRSRRQLKALTNIDAISATEEQTQRYKLWVKIMEKKAEQKAEEDQRLQEKVDKFLTKLKEDKERAIREEAAKEEQRRKRRFYQPVFSLSTGAKFFHDIKIY